MMSRPARCKTISDFNHNAKIGTLALLCKFFRLFLLFLLRFLLKLANFAKKNERKNAYDTEFFNRIPY